MTGKTESGGMTEEFCRRFERNQEGLPTILVEMAALQRNFIEERAEPSQKDVEELLEALRNRLGGLEAGEDTLVETCGDEGTICGLCPFGSFIPPDLGFSSRRQPICLPWISVTRADIASDG